MHLLRIIKDENGASLIEIISSLLIIGIIVVTVLNLSGFTSLSFIKSKDRSDAMLLAEQELHKTFDLLASDTPIQSEKINDGFRIVIHKTSMISSPTYNNIPAELDSTVSLQGIGLDKNGTQFLITITVFYGRN
jgi:hypothetical protein